MKTGATAPGAARRCSSASLALASLAVSAFTLSASPARAQEESSSFEYAFANPGARALGLAGAFAPLADDATAAFANPAGLVQLLRTELSGELRFSLVSGPEEEPVTEMKGLSYISLVVPGSRWSLAVFAHHLANFEFTASRPTSDAASRFASTGMLQDETSTTQLDIARYGLAGGYRVGERLSIGVGVSYFKSTVEGDAGSGEAAASVVGAPEPDTADWAFNAGLLWSVTDRWSLGGFYREGPEFTLAVPSGSGLLGYDPNASEDVRPLSLPDAFGLGTAHRFVDGALTVAFEWDRVEYSDLTEPLEHQGTPGGWLDLDDADELHLGAEWAFLKDVPVIALRAGLWYEPSHRSWRQDDGASQDLDDDLFHQTFGIGWAWKRSQLDFGVDVAEQRVVLSVSAIFSF